MGFHYILNPPRMCNLRFSLVSNDKSVRSLWFSHKRLRLYAGLMKLRS